jgi:hypothetical protein
MQAARNRITGGIVPGGTNYQVVPEYSLMIPIFSLLLSPVTIRFLPQAQT